MPWQSQGGACADPSAFLFSLSDGANRLPCKLEQFQYPQHAVHHTRHRGPLFGFGGGAVRPPSGIFAVCLTMPRHGAPLQHAHRCTCVCMPAGAVFPCVNACACGCACARTGPGAGPGPAAPRRLPLQRGHHLPLPPRYPRRPPCQTPPPPVGARCPPPLCARRTRRLRAGYRPRRTTSSACPRLPGGRPQCRPPAPKGRRSDRDVGAAEEEGARCGASRKPPRQGAAVTSREAPP